MGLTALVVLLGTGTASAHPLGFGSGELLFEAGEFRLELALDTPDEEASLPDSQRRRSLEARLARAVVIDFGAAGAGQTEFRVLSLGEGTSAVDVVEYAGPVPAQAASVRVALADVAGDVALEIRSLSGTSVFRELVVAGEKTPTLSLVPRETHDVDAGSGATGDDVAGASGAARWGDERSAAEAAPAGDRQPSSGPGVWAMTKVGFEHILPGGWDHVLFVLGLLLTTPRLRRLVLELSVFTVAHSMTLALCAAGVVTVSASVVEPLIALSIAAVGAEYLFRKAGSYRLLIVLCFGLLHGLGFASALAATGLTGAGLWRSLLGFNLGVELGQLCVAVLAWLVIRKLRELDGFEQRWLPRGAVAFVVLGVGWALLRVV